jgi:arylsulfatase B
MVANIDDNVGKMREWLDEKGLTENTIFIFTTDNGTAGGRSTFDGGMRGAKGSEYDGGHRVPLFLHWPGGGFDAENKVETITAHVDVVPTLIDLCGVKAPEGVKFDGVSIRPLIESTQRPDGWPDRILVTDSQRVKDPIKWRKSAVMTNEWRLVSNEGKNGTPKHELYAIKQDPRQEKDVIADHPEVAERLKAFYEEWWADIAPSFGDPARIHIGNPAENPSRLTSHDWITTGSSPWNQKHIRDGVTKPGNLGFWYLTVEEAGDYEIELRRWPNEGKVADVAITAPIPGGAPVPGGPAFRETPGKAVPAKTANIEIQGHKLSSDVPEGATNIKFDITLEAGPAELFATFVGEKGEVTGAFFAYVKKK